MQMKRLLAVALCAGLFCAAAAHRSLQQDDGEAEADSTENFSLEGTRNPCSRNRDKCVGLEPACTSALQPLVADHRPRLPNIPPSTHPRSPPAAHLARSLAGA